MKEFTLDDENLLWGFFDELNISCSSIFERELQKQFPSLTNQEVQDIAEDNYDEIQDEIGASGIIHYIKAESIEETEVEEATGLWGHFRFEIDNEQATIAYFEREIEELMKDLVLRFAREGRFDKNH